MLFTLPHPKGHGVKCKVLLLLTDPQNQLMYLQLLTTGASALSVVGSNSKKDNASLCNLQIVVRSMGVLCIRFSPSGHGDISSADSQKNCACFRITNLFTSFSQPYYKDLATQCSYVSQFHILIMYVDTYRYIYIYIKYMYIKCFLLFLEFYISWIIFIVCL